MNDARETGTKLKTAALSYILLNTTCGGVRVGATAHVAVGWIASSGVPERQFDYAIFPGRRCRRPRGKSVVATFAGAHR